MEKQRVRRMIPAICDSVLIIVMSYIDDPKDRDAISLVCREWYEIDALTRKHVTIALCYTTTPARLRSRFQHLESLKLKGKPWADMFNLVPEDWGGYVAPWVKEIAESFNCLKSIHFRRMIVTDSDLELLVRTRGRALLTLKIDRCSGFSTDGLLEVGRYCRNLKHLFLEESQINEKDGNWLHELATNNTVLETLNFYLTYLAQVRIEDLELIGRNCLSLSSVKISGCDILDLVGFLRTAVRLEEFCGGSFNLAPEEYSSLSLPKNLRKLGLFYISRDAMHVVFPFASLLKKLDLMYAFLSTDDHCALLQRCPNLEILEARFLIGDRGLEVVGQTCKRLKRLRVERGVDEPGLEYVAGNVSHRGLIALAQGCLELEYLAVYVSDIANTALEHIGTLSKNLRDFRLVLLDREELITDLPLDQGVRALLMGCEKLRKFALYLRPGGLTDVGLRYIAQYSQNVRWMLLGCVGESDTGILEFSTGCPNLQKLVIRDCIFGELALAVAVTHLKSLRYFWVQEYRSSITGRDLLAMTRPYWSIELIPGQHGEDAIVKQSSEVLAYYSLAGQRTDFPTTVKPFDPDSFGETIFSPEEIRLLFFPPTLRL